MLVQPTIQYLLAEPEDEQERHFILAVNVIKKLYAYLSPKIPMLELDAVTHAFIGAEMDAFVRANHSEEEINSSEFDMEEVIREEFESQWDMHSYSNFIDIRESLVNLDLCFVRYYEREDDNFAEFVVENSPQISLFGGRKSYTYNYQTGKCTTTEKSFFFREGPDVEAFEETCIAATLLSGYDGYYFGIEDFADTLIEESVSLNGDFTRGVA